MFSGRIFVQKVILKNSLNFLEKNMIIIFFSKNFFNHSILTKQAKNLQPTLVKVAK